MHRVLILFVLLVSSFSIAAQESFSSVEERMTGKEFMSTGLSKLTDAELESLNRWLRDHSVATMESSLTHRNAAADAAAAAARPVPSTQTSAPVQSKPGSTAPATSDTSVATSNVDKRGFEGKDNDRNTIVSQFIGEFKGWDGETVFKLQNGQVWKQSEKGRQITKLLVNPVVTIKSGMFNSWHLTVEGYNRNVQVERIQ